MGLLERVAAERKSHSLRFGGGQGFEEPKFWERLPIFTAPVGEREEIEADFESFVERIYKADGIVFACILTRMWVFSEARFLYQRFERGRPGDLFFDDGLELLENPWPNATTGELLAHMDQDASLAGNFYATTVTDGAGRRIRRLRPDWVTIITGSPSDDPFDIRARVIGYLYDPARAPSSASGRPLGQAAPVLLTPDQVVHYCVDEETEILTAAGWKDYATLSSGDEVLTLNHETGMSEWQPVSEVCVFPAQRRNMLRMEGAEHSSLTTLNHRWPVERRNARAGRYERRWATSESFSTGDYVPTAAFCADLPREQKWTDALVELVAWFWTEGTIRRQRDGRLARGVSISQSRTVNPSNVERIRAALMSLFGAPVDKMQRTGPAAGRAPCWREATDGNNAIFHLSADAVDVITCHAPGRVVTTEFIRSLTRSQLDLFIKTSVLADGWQDPNGRTRLAQKDRAAAEQFALACIVAGYSVSIRQGWLGDCGYRMHVVSVNKTRHFGVGDQRSRFKRTRTTHDGVVWCPRTPNGTWLARRNGSVYFTGNSPIPDPIAQWRGMSWITPVLGEIMGDKAATRHKLRFFESGATAKYVVTYDSSLTKDQFDQYVKAFQEQNEGLGAAYKTIHLGGGADAKVLGTDLKELEFKATQGAGEPLAVDTPIPTPDGWTTMGDIEVGAEVIGRDGLPALVTSRSPVHLGRDCYRVTFNDRTSIIADASHLWAAMDRNTNDRAEATYTTAQLRELINEWKTRGNGGNRIGVPAARAAKLPDRDLLIDPYVLGVWLGDGQTAGAAICGEADDVAFIASEIERRGYTTTRWKVQSGKVPVIGIPGGLLFALDALGVLGNKLIPDDYLRASYEQRLDLLRGLMDTDGTVGHVGKESCSFSSKWQHLARQVADLVRSLGQRATLSRRADVRSRTGGTWTVQFRGDPDAVPFLLPRKAARCRTPLHVRNRAIISIDPVDSVPVRCIAVDSPDHLFCVGDGWVLTHNTRIAAAAGTHPVIVGLSEGLAGSSLNAGNFKQARRAFADKTMRPLWRIAAASLAKFTSPPPRTRLWYDDRDIPFLRDDQADVAEIQSRQAAAIRQLVDAGYDPDAVIDAVQADDFALLRRRHSGLFSVQLQPPMTPEQIEAAAADNGSNGNGAALPAATGGT